MSRGPAGLLGRTDLQAILDFLADVSELEFDRPYPSEFVARLGELIPGAHALYRENDLRGRSTPLMVDGTGSHLDDADELYWTVGPCPVTRYRSRTRDLSAARLTDVVDWRRYRETPVYREYFGLGGVDHMLDLALQVGAGWQRTFLFCREKGDRDFTERNRAVLEVLRPHLTGFEAEASLRRQLGQVLRAQTLAPAPARDARLTEREREIVILVGAGRTNAQIAAELWVTPGTVKKHLEHVYEKLGVGSRAAAAASTLTAH